MPAADVLPEETELERIQAWRTEELMRCGYSYKTAARLAERQDVDLHLAIALVERGCEPDLAVRILL